MKKFFLSFLILIFLFNFANFVFAQEPPRPLEIEYPQITPEHIEIPTTVETPIPVYIRYIYYFILGICGLIALGALIYAGIRYSTSAGNPQALQDAKDQIFAALFGILILLGSWLILYNINPQLVVLRVPTLIPLTLHLPAGVWLCKEDKFGEFNHSYQYIESFKNQEKQLETATGDEREQIISSLQKLSEGAQKNLKKIYEKCYLVEGLGNIKGDFDNKITHAYLVPDKISDNEYKNYAAILFEEPAYKGNIEILYTQDIYKVPTGPRPGGWGTEIGKLSISKPSSIIPIIINPKPDPDWKVIVYEEVDYNKGFQEGTKYKMVFPDECTEVGGCTNGYDYCYWCMCSNCLDPSPKSIENKGGAGKWIAILSKGASQQAWREESDVFAGSDANLLDNERITEEDCGFLGIFRCQTVPAAKAIFMISGSIY